jgi:hypothetical protein
MVRICASPAKLSRIFPTQAIACTTSDSPAMCAMREETKKTCVADCKHRKIAVLIARHGVVRGCLFRRIFCAARMCFSRMVRVACGAEDLDQLRIFRR